MIELMLVILPLVTGAIGYAIAKREDWMHRVDSEVVASIVVIILVILFFVLGLIVFNESWNAIAHLFAWPKLDIWQSLALLIVAGGLGWAWRASGGPTQKQIVQIGGITK